MANPLFTKVPVPSFPRSTFSLSRAVLFTPRLQKIYPANVIEIIPGDGINERGEAYAKSQPMVAPTFGKMDFAQEAFFVPAWQLNEHFDDFITGGERGTYSDKMPYVTVGNFYSFVNALLTKINSYCDTAAKYNQAIEKVQDIIELCDILRAVPFVLPDFVLATTSTLSSVATANLGAYQSANLHLQGSTLRINLLPFGAYMKVYSEFYRDENLVDDIFDLIWKGSAYNSAYAPYYSTGQFDFYQFFGYYISSVSDYDSLVTALSDYHALFGIKNRAWKHDYFTSALPWTQKGPEVLIPLTGFAPLQFGSQGSATGAAASVSTIAQAVGNYPYKATVGFTGVGGSAQSVEGYANLAQTEAGASIQDWRRAMRLEEMYEADARFGNRYPENTLGQFGVRTPDSRLPRCQFLGSNSQPVTIQEVVQTSSTDATTPQGNLAGKATSYGANRLCKTYQTMHGFLINLGTLRTHAVYEGGIHPMFSRYDRTEYAWPRFANLGEQPIYEKQLYVDGTVTEDEVFGYTPRYAEYKSETSSIHGALKGSLNFWTMARRFANKPVLSKEFIYGKPRQDAWVIQNYLQAPFVMEIDYRVRANRLLPFFGVPTI